MTTEDIRPLVAILLSALHQADKRKQLIAEFQQRVWDAPEDLTATQEWEILRDLAYDLDFYEPDANVRAEDASYYGDERVEREIKTALKKLESSED